MVTLVCIDLQSEALLLSICLLVLLADGRTIKREVIY
jgi:hypothetical protein